MGKDRVIHVELPFNMTTDMLELDHNIAAEEAPQGIRYQIARLAEDYTSQEIATTLIAAVSLYTHLNGGVGNIGMYGETVNFARCLATARIWMRG